MGMSERELIPWNVVGDRTIFVPMKQLLVDSWPDCRWGKLLVRELPHDKRGGKLHWSPDQHR